MIVCACLVLQPQLCVGFNLRSPSIRQSAVSRPLSQRPVRSYSTSQINYNSRNVLGQLQSKVENKDEEEKEPSAFDQVASKGLAGVLAIAAAEA